MTDKTPAAHPKAPDAHVDCPRCHYWEQHAEELFARGRGTKSSVWPLGIDQGKALDLLVKAFPKSYGSR